jgi:hypothetical protein
MTTCIGCNKTFSTLSYAKRHIKNNICKKIKPNNICKKIKSNNINSIKTKLKCNYCNKSYVRQTGLDKHLLSKHNDILNKEEEKEFGDSIEDLLSSPEDQYYIKKYGLEDEIINITSNTDSNNVISTDNEEKKEFGDSIEDLLSSPKDQYYIKKYGLEDEINNINFDTKSYNNVISKNNKYIKGTVSDTKNKFIDIFSKFNLSEKYNVFDYFDEEEPDGIYNIINTDLYFKNLPEYIMNNKIMRNLKNNFKIDIYYKDKHEYTFNNFQSLIDVSIYNIPIKETKNSRRNLKIDNTLNIINIIDESKINQNKNMIIESKLKCCHCDKIFTRTTRAKKHIWFYCDKVNDNCKYDLINTYKITNYNFESLLNYTDELDKVGLHFLGKHIYNKLEIEHTKTIFFDDYRLIKPTYDSMKNMFNKIQYSYENDTDITDEEVTEGKIKMEFTELKKYVANREIIKNEIENEENKDS